MGMDIYVKKAVEDTAKAQLEATERLIAQQETTNRWLAHVAALLEAQVPAKV
jgi:hypothetical protein